MSVVHLTHVRTGVCQATPLTTVNQEKLDVRVYRFQMHKPYGIYFCECSGKIIMTGGLCVNVTPTPTYYVKIEQNRRERSERAQIFIWYIGNVLVCAHFSSILAHGTYCLCSITQVFRLLGIV